MRDKDSPTQSARLGHGGGIEGGEDEGCAQHVQTTSIYVLDTVVGYCEIMSARRLHTAYL